MKKLFKAFLTLVILSVLSLSLFANLTSVKALGDEVVIQDNHSSEVSNVNGSSVPVVFSLESGYSVIAFELKLKYNTTAFDLASVVKSDVLPNDLIINTATDGEILITYSSTSTIAVGANLFTVNLTVDDMTTFDNTEIDVLTLDSEYANIATSFDGTNFATPDIASDFSRAYVGTPSALMGDVSGDGRVSILDATLIQLHIAGLKLLTAEQEALADVYADGNINIADVVRIQLYLVGMISSLDSDVFYSVTFYNQDGTTILSRVKVKKGGSAVAPTAPTIDGYTFTGWDKDISEVTSDLKVTAQYKSNALPTYTVTFYDGTTLLGTTPNITSGTGVVLGPELPTKEGYTSSWSVDITCVTSDMVVYVVYTLDTDPLASQKAAACQKVYGYSSSAVAAASTLVSSTIDAINAATTEEDINALLEKFVVDFRTYAQWYPTVSDKGALVVFGGYALNVTINTNTIFATQGDATNGYRTIMVTYPEGLPKTLADGDYIEIYGYVSEVGNTPTITVVDGTNDYNAPSIYKYAWTLNETGGIDILRTTGILTTDGSNYYIGSIKLSNTFGSLKGELMSNTYRHYILRYYDGTEYVYYSMYYDIVSEKYTIQDLRNYLDNGSISKSIIVDVEGDVLYKRTNGLFIKDETGILYIYTNGMVGSDIKLGQHVYVRGTATIYYGMAEIKDIITFSKTMNITEIPFEADDEVSLNSSEEPEYLSEHKMATISGLLLKNNDANPKYFLYDTESATGNRIYIDYQYSNDQIKSDLEYYLGHNVTLNVLVESYRSDYKCWSVVVFDNGVAQTLGKAPDLSFIFSSVAPTLTNSLTGDTAVLDLGSGLYAFESKAGEYTLTVQDSGLTFTLEENQSKELFLTTSDGLTFTISTEAVISSNDDIYKDVTIKIVDYGYLHDESISYNQGMVLTDGSFVSDGYIFAGLYTDSAFTNQVTLPYTVTLLSDGLKFYVKWTLDPSVETITFTIATFNGKIVNSFVVAKEHHVYVDSETLLELVLLPSTNLTGFYNQAGLTFYINGYFYGYNSNTIYVNYIDYADFTIEDYNRYQYDVSFGFDATIALVTEKGFFFKLGTSYIYAESPVTGLNSGDQVTIFGYKKDYETFNATSVTVNTVATEAYDFGTLDPHQDDGSSSVYNSGAFSFTGFIDDVIYDVYGNVYTILNESTTLAGQYGTFTGVVSQGYKVYIVEDSFVAVTPVPSSDVELLVQLPDEWLTDGNIPMIYINGVAYALELSEGNIYKYTLNIKYSNEFSIGSGTYRVNDISYEAEPDLIVISANEKGEYEYNRDFTTVEKKFDYFESSFTANYDGQTVDGNIDIPSTYLGVTFVMTSSSTSVIMNNGRYLGSVTDTTVTLTVLMTCGDSQRTGTVTVNITGTGDEDLVGLYTVDEIKEEATGNTFKVIGTVIYINGTVGFYIEGNKSGNIYVYNSAKADLTALTYGDTTSSLAVGDTVVITGTSATYNSVTQLNLVSAANIKIKTKGDATYSYDANNEVYIRGIAQDGLESYLDDAGTLYFATGVIRVSSTGVYSIFDGFNAVTLLTTTTNATELSSYVGKLVKLEAFLYNYASSSWVLLYKSGSVQVDSVIDFSTPKYYENGNQILRIYTLGKYNISLFADGNIVETSERFYIKDGVFYFLKTEDFSSVMLSYDSATDIWIYMGEEYSLSTTKVADTYEEALDLVDHKYVGNLNGLTLTVSQALTFIKAGMTGTITTSGIVVAVDNAGGYMIADSENVLYVYGVKDTTVQVGDNVTITAAGTIYRGTTSKTYNAQLTSTNYSVVINSSSNASPITKVEPAELDKLGLVNSETTTSGFEELISSNVYLNKIVSVTGVVTLSDDSYKNVYLNVTKDGVEYSFSIYYTSANQDIMKALVGKEVTMNVAIVGYIIANKGYIGLYVDGLTVSSVTEEEQKAYIKAELDDAFSKIEMIKESVSFPATSAYSSLFGGVVFVYSSSLPAVLSNAGVYTAPEAKTTITITVTVTIGTLESYTLTYDIVVKPESVDYTYDFVTKFADLGWSTSYTTHTVDTVNLGTYAVNANVVFSNANKQNSGNTIDDRPVIVAKNTTQYITLSEKTTGDFANITGFSVVLAQWGTKTFTDIHLEYSKDGGETWVICSNVITTPGALSSNVEIEGANMFRVSITTTATTNVQVGLTSITLSK